LNGPSSQTNSRVSFTPQEMPATSSHCSGPLNSKIERKQLVLKSKCSAPTSVMLALLSWDLMVVIFLLRLFTTGLGLHASGVRLLGAVVELGPERRTRTVGAGAHESFSTRSPGAAAGIPRSFSGARRGRGHASSSNSSSDGQGEEARRTSAVHGARRGSMK
jgi:hypothetical protein